MMNQHSIKIVNLDPETEREASSKYTGPPWNFVLVGQGKQLLPGKYRNFADTYRNFKLRPSDVIIAGFPRSGTTVTESMIWLLLNNLDFRKASELDHYTEKIPFFEATTFYEDVPETENFMKSLEILEEMSTKQRRVFKTHLHLELLPTDLLTVGCKVIYVARHPKDVAVSYYHLEKNALERKFTEDFPAFFEYFQKDLVLYAPYWSYIKDGWTRRNSPNLLFVFYETFRRDPKKYIRDISTFINVHLNEEQVDLLARHLDFDNFKKQNTQIYLNRKFENTDTDFLRKGKMGGWKDYFTPEMNAKADPWIAENIRKIGIIYPFEV